MGLNIVRLGVLLLLFSSCTVKTNLSYEPVTAKLRKKDVVLKLNDFEDERTKKDYIGCFRNLYYYPVYTVASLDSPSKWVADALKTELERSGYSVKYDGEGASIEVFGRIYDIYCDSWIRYNGRIKLDISIKKNGEEVFEKTYKSNVNNGIVWILNPNSSAKAIEMNLQAINKEIIDDINHTVF